ncbi:MAG TPA: hypothetical protein VE891_00805 [Allosphingosinicella sp.]|nr:hypothetical protein [Allosphingosinicella sp.]
MSDFFDEDSRLPAGLVPTPTREFNQAFDLRQLRRQSVRPALKLVRAADADEAPAGAAAAPRPVLFGSRAFIYKQDPSVDEIGIRKVLLRGALHAGPRSARIALEGMAPIAPNTMNDFIQAPGSDGFDAVHTFAVAHQALAMCQRALGAPIKWQWNGPGDTTPIAVFPHAGQTQNAFYSRTARCLKFFFFPKPGAPAPAPTVFTCRSFDIVTHEMGHAILDSLKPGWLGASGDPESGALHEAFGDILAIFLTLSQLDQVEALIVQTKGDLHNKTFLSDVAEEFGLALGRDNGLRNADNDKTMSQVSSEVHDLSQVFTGGVYDVLADIFELERDIAREDESATLLRVGQTVFSIILRAMLQAPDTDASFADVVREMIALCPEGEKGRAYRRSIVSQFARREVVAAEAAAAKQNGAPALARVEHSHIVVKANGLQDRSACCGTMRLREYSEIDLAFDAELAALEKGYGGMPPARSRQAAAATKGDVDRSASRRGRRGAAR